MLAENLKPIKGGFKIEGKGILIRKRPGTKNWEVCIWVGDEKRYKIISSGTDNQNEAIAFALKKQGLMEYQKELGIEIFPISFKKIAGEWLEQFRKREKNGNESGNMLRVYEAALRLHLIPFFGDVSINKIKREQVEPYITYMIDNDMASESSFGNHNAAFKGVLKYAMERGIYKHVVIPDIERPKYREIDKETRARFTDWEIDRITENLDRYLELETSPAMSYNRKILAAIIHFMLATGCRPHDLGLVKWSDCELRKNEETVHKFRDKHEIVGVLSKLSYYQFESAQSEAKNKKDDIFLHIYLRGKNRKRWVPIDPEYIPHFMWWLKTAKFTSPDDLIFAGNNGKYSLASSVWLKRYLEFLEIPSKTDDGVRVPYSFRHTFITRKLVEGAEPLGVAKQCGTSIWHIENTYSHMLPQELYRKIFKVQKGEEENNKKEKIGQAKADVKSSQSVLGLPKKP